jgi:hypothetical protein
MNESVFYWSRTRADAISINNNQVEKPFLDHSLQSSKGHYLLMATPQEYTVGDNALLSINLKSSLNNCIMRVWYSLSDDKKGTLKIATRKSIGSEFNYKATFVTQSFDWKRVDIDIGADPTPFQVKS